MVYGLLSVICYLLFAFYCHAKRDPDPARAIQTELSRPSYPDPARAIIICLNYFEFVLSFFLLINAPVLFHSVMPLILFEMVVGVLGVVGVVRVSSISS